MANKMKMMEQYKAWESHQKLKWVHDQIKTNAYFRWENSGCPENQSIRFWNEAKEEVFASTEVLNMPEYFDLYILVDLLDYTCSEECTIDNTLRYSEFKYDPLPNDERDK